MMVRALGSVVAFALGLAIPQIASAGPVTVDGVRYDNAEAARRAMQRAADIKVEQTPRDYLRSVNVAPLGGKYTVLLPGVEDVKKKYVWVTGGIFKPGNETQGLVAESVIMNMKVRFLALKRVGFIDDIELLDESTPSSQYGQTDYIIRLITDFNGERTPQALQFRKTEWVVSSRLNGTSKTAFTTYGSPTNVDALTIFSGMREAVSAISK